MQDAPFKVWCKKWMDLANYPGPHLQEPTTRIKKVLELWNEEVPTAWQRPDLPSRLHSTIPKYSRGNRGSEPKASEQELEAQLFGAQEGQGIVFKPYTTFSLLANAYPLAIEKTVEADALALAFSPGEIILFLVEIKTRTNNPWYAAVENLRQLKLLSQNQEGYWRQVWEKWGTFIQSRVPGVTAFPLPTATGLVLAPPSFYSARGQKANAAPIASQLAKELERQDPPVHLQFGEWIPATSEIRIRQP